MFDILVFSVVIPCIYATIWCFRKACPMTFSISGYFNINIHMVRLRREMVIFRKQTPIYGLIFLFVLENESQNT